MPHVVLDWVDDVSKLGETFTPLIEETSEWRIVIKHWYTEKKHHKALIPVTVVEEGHVQNFYAIIARNEHKNCVTLRLDANTDPVKTRGVKRSLAFLAEHILESMPDIRLKNHNLEGFFKR